MDSYSEGLLTKLLSLVMETWGQFVLRQGGFSKGKKSVHLDIMISSDDILYHLDIMIF